MSICIHLADNSTIKLPKKVSVLELAQSIDSKLAKRLAGALINSSKDVVDVRHELQDQDRVQWVSIPSKESLEVVRHSAAHVLAQAVQELWPGTQVTIGPVIEDGFYYDFYREIPFQPSDLIKMEKKMNEIIRRQAPILKEVWPAKKAIKTFKELGEMYKVEIIEDLGEKEVSIYKQEKWFDLCRGPHLQHLGHIGAVKVLGQSAAYWRGDETKASLQRVYATAFHSTQDLGEHLKILEEVKKRDHRKIGKEMNIFYFNDLAAGQPFFKTAGTIIYNELTQFLRSKYKEHNYEEIISPQIYDKELYIRSGHDEFYKSNMYTTRTLDDHEAYLKPMNCPGHCLLFKSQKWSYKDLPWRVADFGRLHRYERSGTLHGLSRVRSFCQDDAHIFCTADTLESEILNFIKLLDEVYKIIGLENYKIVLSTRPEKKMGSDAIWTQAEQALEQALKKQNISYEINEGDGAFYGPKLDIMVTDSLKRSWQLGTLQCDFNLPEVFNLNYVSAENKTERPIMLHRAILGSLERFIGILIEHYAGKLPSWLCPVQAVLINISQDQESYIKELYTQAQRESNLRLELDVSAESLSYKIRKARMKRIPYMVIVGKKEQESGQVSIRTPEGKNVSMKWEDFVSTLKKETLERKVSYSSF